MLATYSCCLLMYLQIEGIEDVSHTDVSGISLEVVLFTGVIAVRTSNGGKSIHKQEGLVHPLV